MGALDAALGTVSKQLIDQFGTPLVLRQVDDGEYDTTTGRKERIRRDRIVKGVFEPYRARFAKGRPPSGTRASEFQITIAAQQGSDPDLFRAPAETDQVVLGAWVNYGTDELPDVRGGEVHEIVHVDPIRSGDDVALYVLHVRR